MDRNKKSRHQHKWEVESESIYVTLKCYCGGSKLVKSNEEIGKADEYGRRHKTRRNWK